MKVLVVYYSMYRHIHRMAQAVAEGVEQVGGARAELRRVPETLSRDILEKMGALEAQQSMENIPVATVEDLKEADAIVFGTPTRFGNMCGQMRQFLDATGGLWASGSLVGKVGKVGSVFTSSNTQHGGQTRMDEITGCSPYGASTIAGSDGTRTPSNNELEGARYQGRHVATLAKRLMTD